MASFAVAVRGTYGGQVVANTFGVMTDDQGLNDSQALAQTVADRVKTVWVARLLPTLSNQYVVTGVTARAVHTADIVAESAGGGTGALTEPGLPGFACVKVRLTSSLGGRPGKGRTGIVGAGEGSTGSDPNRIQDVSRNAYQTAMNGIVSDLAATNPSLKLAVISRYKGVDAAGRPIKRPDGPVVSNVIAVTVESVLGTRVSRLR